MRIQRGTGGPDPHLENHKANGFLSNASLEPLTNHKAVKRAKYMAIICVPAKQYLVSLSPNQRKQQQKIFQSCTTSDKIFWVVIWLVFTFVVPMFQNPFILQRDTNSVWHKPISLPFNLLTHLGSVLYGFTLTMPICTVNKYI